MLGETEQKKDTGNDVWMRCPTSCSAIILHKNITSSLLRAKLFSGSCHIFVFELYRLLAFMKLKTLAGVPIASRVSL